MPIINRVLRKIRKARKRYVVDVPPNVKRAFLKACADLGVELVEAAARGAVQGAKGSR